MLTDKEKAIALEIAHRTAKTYRHNAEEPYSFDENCMVTAFDKFLSSVREEQEAVAWRYIDCSDEGTCCHMYNEMRQGEPLFTTPPSAPDCDKWKEAYRVEKLSSIKWAGKCQELEHSCSELVEVLEHISTHPCEDSIDAQRMTKVAREAISSHAKRTRGEE